MRKSNIEESSRRTREVYLQQHKKYIEDDVIFSRFLSMVSDPAYFYLSQDDIRGKTMLDAGCGNSAYLEVGMWQLGIGHMTCLDLGKEWIPYLHEAFQSFGIPDAMVDFVDGSTDDLHFPDNHFDIVFSNGVLMHLYDLDQVAKAFEELARVTTPGGYLYVVLGCPGGLIEEQIIPAIRKFYRSNPAFKVFVDTLSPQVFNDCFETMAKGMEEYTGEIFDYSGLVDLFDVDLCTTIQNFTQVPKRHILALDEDWVFKAYAEHGFESPKRCKRYVIRKNIRKFFAPLHYDSNNPFSQLLYGPGNLEFIGRKNEV